MTITGHDDHGYIMLHLSTNLIADPNRDANEPWIAAGFAQLANGNTAGSGSVQQVLFAGVGLLQGVLLSYDHL